MNSVLNMDSSSKGVFTNNLNTLAVTGATVSLSKVYNYALTNTLNSITNSDNGAVSGTIVIPVDNHTF